LKRRHIEITAFRRRTTVTGDAIPGNTHEPQSADTQWNPSAGASAIGAVAAKQEPVTIEAISSPELSMLVKAFIDGNEDSTLAARQLGLSRSTFYKRVRKLGISLRQLKSRLNILRPSRHTNASGVEKTLEQIGARR